MIDQIFEMIMKEARGRPGKDLVSKINTVLLEVNAMVTKAMEDIWDQESRRKRDETKTGHP